MGFQVEDGTGSGFTAKVDANSRLHVKSTQISAEHFAAESGDAYSIFAEGVTKVNAGAGLIYIKNNSVDKNYVITRIYTAGHTITPTDLVLSMQRNPVATLGTDVSSTAIVNTNFGSAKVLDATVLLSTIATGLTLTGGVDFQHHPVTTMANLELNTQGSIIIAPQKTIGFGYYIESGGNAVLNEEIAVTVALYVES